MCVELKLHFLLLNAILQAPLLAELEGTVLEQSRGGRTLLLLRALLADWATAASSRCGASMLHLPEASGADVLIVFVSATERVFHPYNVCPCIECVGWCREQIGRPFPSSPCLFQGARGPCHRQIRAAVSEQ